jgi:hypothetical protein
MTRSDWAMVPGASQAWEKCARSENCPLRETTTLSTVNSIVRALSLDRCASRRPSKELFRLHRSRKFCASLASAQGWCSLRGKQILSAKHAVAIDPEEKWDAAEIIPEGSCINAHGSSNKETLEAQDGGAHEDAKHTATTAELKKQDYASEVAAAARESQRSRLENDHEVQGALYIETMQIILAGPN